MDAPIPGGENRWIDGPLPCSGWTFLGRTGAWTWRCRMRRDDVLGLIVDRIVDESFQTRLKVPVVRLRLLQGDDRQLIHW